MLVRRTLVVLLALQLFASTVWAQGLREDVRYLVSDATAGREVGTDGHDRARDYIIKRMKQAGLEPAGTDGWLVPVNLVARSVPHEVALRLGDHVLAADHEYQVADFSDAVTLAGTPVFVGYGLQAPEYGWNDYADVDVDGRIVVVLDGGPPNVVEDVTDADRFMLTAESKAAVALTHGANAVLFVHDPRSYGDATDQREDRLETVRPAFALEGIGAAWITERVASEILSGAGLDLTQYQQTLDQSGPQSVELPLEVQGHLELQREVVTVHDVVGKLPGAATGSPIVVGAHYDHLGLGGPASRFDGPPSLHPGADDNASGVAVLLEAARRLRNESVGRPVYFAAITGEETGLRGSRRLARILYDRDEPPGAYINMDMVGRLGVDPLVVYGLEQAGALADDVRQAAKRGDIMLDERPVDATLSDHVPFAELGWNAVGLSTGRHQDYHRPTDTIDQLDWDGMRRIARMIAGLVGRID